MLELKERVLLSEPTKSIWRKDHKSIERIEANKMYRFLFGVNLGSTSNCDCIEDLFNFLKSKNINQKIKSKMSEEKKQFILKKNKFVQVNKHGNLTSSTSDEKCLAILLDYPNMIKHFQSVPEGWDKVESKEPVQETEAVEETEAVGIDLDSMKVPELKDYIEEKGGEIPDGKKAVILEYAKTL